MLKMHTLYQIFDKSPFYKQSIKELFTNQVILFQDYLNILRTKCRHL